MAPRVVIRTARPDDIPRLRQLCAEHAAYEKAEFAADGDRDARLFDALFSYPQRMWGFVAEAEGIMVGYATCTKDFSTWRAEEYLHMDCLYIIAEHRSLGIGKAMIQALADQALALGCSAVEWQTPAWNEAAALFYKRLGAIANDKIRFRWDYKRCTSARPEADDGLAATQ